VISQAGQPAGQLDPKKPTALRGAVGVRNRESGDRVRGCDGARIHAAGSLARAGGWSVTKIAALLIFGDNLPRHHNQTILH